MFSQWRGVNDYVVDGWRLRHSWQEHNIKYDNLINILHRFFASFVVLRFMRLHGLQTSFSYARYVSGFYVQAVLLFAKRKKTSWILHESI